MNSDLEKHYQSVISIRNKAILRLTQSKELYEKSENPDERILEMYDSEIEFLQKSLPDISD